MKPCDKKLPIVHDDDPDRRMHVKCQRTDDHDGCTGASDPNLGLAGVGGLHRAELLGSVFVWGDPSPNPGEEEESDHGPVYIHTPEEAGEDAAGWGYHAVRDRGW